MKKQEAKTTLKALHLMEEKRFVFCIYGCPQGQKNNPLPKNHLPPSAKLTF